MTPKDIKQLYLLVIMCGQLNKHLEEQLAMSYFSGPPSRIMPVCFFFGCITLVLLCNFIETLHNHLK